MSTTDKQTCSVPVTIKGVSIKGVSIKGVSIRGVSGLRYSASGLIRSRSIHSEVVLVGPPFSARAPCPHIQTYVHIEILLASIINTTFTLVA